MSPRLHLRVPNPRNRACSGCYKVGLNAASASGKAADAQRKTGRLTGAPGAVPARPGDRRPRCYDATRMEIRERTDSIVSLTPAAAAKIRDLMASEADVSVLRVAIEGGGCSGFQ